MAGKASRENGKFGGRPVGKLNAATVEKLSMLERIKKRVDEATDALLDAQISLALGNSYLYKLDTDDEGRAKKPILVTNREEIEAYLAGDYNELDTTYYYITTEKPDNSAIEALFNRRHGKAQQAVDVTSKGQPIKFMFDPTFKGDAPSRKTESDSQ